MNINEEKVLIFIIGVSFGWITGSLILFVIGKW